MPVKVKPFDVDDMIRRYQSGVSVLELAAEIGVSRGVITHRLGRANVAIRGRSEAEGLKWSRRKASPDYRAIVERQCSGAWRGTTGRVRSESERIKGALTHARKATSRMGRYEAEVALILSARGVAVDPQTAVGPYNVDLGIASHRVAVEIQRSQKRAGRPDSVRRERIEHILNAGWSVLIVYCPPGAKWEGRRTRLAKVEKFDVGAVADEIVAFGNLARALPPGRGKHRVIDGHGKPSSALRRDLDGLP